MLLIFFHVGQNKSVVDGCGAHPVWMHQPDQEAQFCYAVEGNYSQDEGSEGVSDAENAENVKMKDEKVVVDESFTIISPPILTSS